MFEITVHAPITELKRSGDKQRKSHSTPKNEDSQVVESHSFYRTAVIKPCPAENLLNNGKYPAVGNGRQ